jgi:hypothetical protein
MKKTNVYKQSNTLSSMKLLYALVAFVVVMALGLAVTTAYANLPKDHLIDRPQIERVQLPSELRPPVNDPEPPQAPTVQVSGGGGTSCNSSCKWQKQLPMYRKQCFNDLAEEIKPKIVLDMELTDIFSSLSNPDYYLCSGQMWKMFRPFL